MAFSGLPTNRAMIASRWSTGTRGHNSGHTKEHSRYNSLRHCGFSHIGTWRDLRFTTRASRFQDYVLGATDGWKPAFNLDHYGQKQRRIPDTSLSWCLLRR